MQALPLEVAPSQIVGPAVWIDVRDPAARRDREIAGAEPIPMTAIPAALPALKLRAAEATLVLICEHGWRGVQAVRWLRQHGLTRCQSLKGGAAALNW